MSQPRPSVFHINQSGEEQYDIDIELEHYIDTCPPQSNLSAAAVGPGDIIVMPKSEGAGADGDDAIIDVDGGSHSLGITSIMSKCASTLVNKKTAAAVCFMGFCVIVAVSLSGAAEHNRQRKQNALALAAINANVVGGKAGKSNVVGGKAGKSISFCAPAQAVTCGQTFTDEKVVLSDDLFCTDDVGDATNPILRPLNAAITVNGPDAIIDCKGHTIRQMTRLSAPACETSPGNDLNPSRDRRNMKLGCDIYYQAGIILANGATAINCKVEQFYDGFLVVDGGEVKKSEASRNHRGVVIEDYTGSSSVSKISDV